MFNSSINNNDNPNNNDHGHDLNAIPVNLWWINPSSNQLLQTGGGQRDASKYSRREEIDFDERFADFKAIGEMKCDVKTAFELCKVAAEEKGYEMFGVLVSTFLC